MPLIIDEGSVVLFQGDSITDAGRNREVPGDLGAGYAMMCAAWTGLQHPGSDLRFLNRGISGNTLAEMAARWKPDCIDLKPDWVSIMIGVNDSWRWAGGGLRVEHAEYERVYRDTLRRTRDVLGARLVVCEPFLVPSTAEPYDRFRSDLDPKREICRKLAGEFDAVFVAFDAAFAGALDAREAAHWAPDGVHPTPAGHALMAMTWLEAVGAA